MKKILSLVTVLVLVGGMQSVFAADLGGVMPLKSPHAPSLYDWTGFYLGGNVGDAWGKSNWSTPGAAGSMSMAQPIDSFDEAGSFYIGLQAGYDYMLPNRWVIGGEADLSAPSYPSLTGLSVGGMTTFNSPFGSETYSETVETSGTFRGRIGYAPGNWLFYATGGLAWSYDQMTLTNNTTGAFDAPYLWRFGWAAGGGFEVPVAPHWTARLEYLYKDYGSKSLVFANNAQPFTAGYAEQELRAGVDYQFGNNPTDPNAWVETPDEDRVNFHGQTTFTWQGYPAMRGAYNGPQSIVASGQGAETFDATLYAGVRLWQGAEFWANPEIDQGFGLADTHGVSGFPSAESYKLGWAYPYARAQRYFVRQTIDLGDDSQKVDADINQFTQSETANRLVLTIGKFAVVDIFDTNKYANNPKSDFLNWCSVNTCTFDYAGDA